MVTAATSTIPIVTVTPAEAGQFLVKCSRCPRFHTLRPARPGADLVARQHAAGHATPNPADQVDDTPGAGR